MEKYLWGVDLGGTKIEAVVVPASEPTTPIARERIYTEADQGYDHILTRISLLVQKLSSLTGLRPTQVGFGTPGTLDPERQTLKNSNTLCLNGKPLKADLEQHLNLEVRLTNDANCFALAEATSGAGKGARCVFGVIMGTGVGGGLVFNERAWDGCQGNGGEWGHNVLEHDGPECYCGKRGCVEACISGGALERRFERLYGQKLSLKQICQEAGRGDARAEEMLDYLAQRFGQAFSVVINILDPEVIVLGGGLSKIPDLYTKGREAAKRWVFNDRLLTRIVPNMLGDSAGVFGAAALFAQSGPDRAAQ